MTYQELHYTSAAAGLSGFPGFQFVLLPANLDPAVLRQAEALLTYEPPRDAPQQPAPEQLAGFPVALSHTILRSGASILCHAAYLGADYSGRYGNFYAHAIYLPGGAADLGAVLPADTWGSAAWQVREAEGQATPAWVPQAGPSLTATALRDFMTQRSGEAGAVLTGILASFGPDAARPVILVGSDRDAASWVAAASRSLPPALARRLTFTTYTRRPYLSAHQVIGIPPDAEFAFSPAELISRFRVHAAEAGQSSPATPELAWAAAAAAIWQAGQPGVFAAAYAGADIPTDSPDLSGAEDLGGRLAAAALAAGIRLSPALTATAVNWAASRTGPGRPPFWDSLLDSAPGWGGDVPAGLLIRLASAAAGQDRRAAVLAGAYLRRLPSAGPAEPSRASAETLLDLARSDPGIAGAVAAADDHLETALSQRRDPHSALLLLALARIAGNQDAHLSAGEQVLGPALLAGGDQATAAEDLLADPRSQRLRMRVLDFLEDCARQGSGPLTGRLASLARASWLAASDLSDFPVIAAAAILARDPPARPAARFRRAAELLWDAAGEQGAQHAPGLAWPAGPLSAQDALDALAITPEAALIQSTGLDAQCLRLIRARPDDPVIFQLSCLLLDSAGGWLPAADTALLRLLIVTRRLRQADDGTAASDPRGLPAQVPPLLAAAAQAPHSLQAEATEALISVMLRPARLEAATPGLADEIAALISGPPDLLHEYCRRARRDLPSLLRTSPRLHATCFLLWSELPAPGAPGPHPLIGEVLAGAARRMSPPTRAQAGFLIDSMAPGRDLDWEQLTARRSWAGRLLRRPPAPGRQPEGHTQPEDRCKH